MTKQDNNLTIKVESYAGHRSEEKPKRFFLGKNAVNVVEVLDRWLAPDHRYFKVLGDDGAVYILRYDHLRDHWEMIMYDARGYPKAEACD